MKKSFFLILFMITACFLSAQPGNSIPSFKVTYYGPCSKELSQMIDAYTLMSDYYFEMKIFQDGILVSHDTLEDSKDYLYTSSVWCENNIKRKDAKVIFPMTSRCGKNENYLSIKNGSIIMLSIIANKDAKKMNLAVRINTDWPYRGMSSVMNLWNLNFISGNYFYDLPDDKLSINLEEIQKNEISKTDLDSIIAKRK